MKPAVTRKFAERTEVPVAQSQGDIRSVIGRFGGKVLDINEDVPGRAIIMFQSNHVTPRHLRVVMNHPVITQFMMPNDPRVQTCRRKWRALLLDIKSKFVAVDDGIETFDSAFMAWIIGPDGTTLYETAQKLRLLPPPEENDEAA